MNAPNPEWPDAASTDPRLMGWMQGSPPPDDKLVRFADIGHLRFPGSRWAFSHWREFGPTAVIPRGEGSASAWLEAPRALDALPLVSLQGEAMTWGQALMRTYFDGVVVMHRGQVVYERYFGEGGPRREHILFSVTKSFVGTLAAILVHEGVLDPASPVSAIVPELAPSAHGDATVRDVMDMRIGVDYTEDYTDPAASIWAFSRSGGLLPALADDAGPRSFAAFMVGTCKLGEHGAGFSYKTVNTQILAWLIERATGRRLADLLSERIWAPIGAECDASIGVDSTGAAFGGGGLCATVRDLARFGDMLRNGGRQGGVQVVPAAVVADIVAGGDRDAFAQAPMFRATLPGWSYRSMWWVSAAAEGAFMARGIHGQSLYVHPASGVVIARTASHPAASNVYNDPITLPAFRAVVQALGYG
jgi:CubicO group peptidase (beta-lactamase class C family)